MGVYKDQVLAKCALTEIRKAYSDEVDIVVTSDGGHEDLEFEKFCLGLSVKYVHFPGPPLKQKLGGAWFLRALETSKNLCPDFDYLIKIDPDTQIKRAFKYIPDADYFGNIRIKATEHIQGGCIGLSAHAVRSILDSGLLSDTKYESTKYSYRRFSITYLRPGETASSVDLSVEDFIVWDIVKRLGLKIQEWSDINCHTISKFDNPPDLSGDYTAVHPVISSFKRELYADVN